MWMNFLNLAHNDMDDFLAGDEPRASVSVMVISPNSVSMSEVKINKTKVWMVDAHTHSCIDPKAHFDNYDKALKFYMHLCNVVANPCDYIEIDVLEHGAL